MWRLPDGLQGIFESGKKILAYIPAGKLFVSDGKFLWLYTPSSNRAEKMKFQESEDMLALRDPELKMVWVERGNPVTQNPETHTVLKAFRSL